MNELQTQIYEFRDFRVDAAKRLLTKGNDESVPLTPKVFDTLLYLVRHRGRVIEKDELMREIWADTIVEENNLSQNISILRRAFGEKPGEHRFIATVPGHGFRFVPEVSEIEERVEVEEREKGRKGEGEGKSESADDFVARKVVRSPGVWLTAIAVIAVVGLGMVVFGFWGIKFAPSAQIKTVAVLPFKPVVLEKRDESLEIGMADTLIARLGNNREIVVRPLSSIRKYGDLEQDALIAGRELGVDSVLDGSIQRRGDAIRVNVRLIKTADGTSLWTGTFDEKFTDVFLVQDTISNKVAAALRLQLGGDEQKRLTKRDTENVEAYQSYLKGRFHWNKRAPQDLRKSIEHFQQAIALDPNYALAFAGLADAYTLLANAGAPAHEIMPKAREAALKAVLLDDNLAEAHAALGNTIIYYDYDFAGAEREHQRAIELNPNYATARHWYSELLMGLGRHTEALAEIRRALEIDPLSLLLNRQYGASLLFARQYDASIAQMKKTVELDANFAVGHSTLSVAYRMKGNYAESVGELAKFQELIGGEQTAALMRESFAKGGWQEFLRAMTDERRPANLTSYNVATFHAALGEKDKALVELNKAYQNREGILGLLKVDPRFDSLHDDPRFQDLLRRINL